MLRKLTLAAAATAALGFVALAPTTASAYWHGHHHGFWGGPRYAFAAPAYVYGNPCIRTRWVPTPWGPRLRRVNVCY
ncbi:MAG: sulfur globule protein precursor [Xanthobacteraceae bacterium]